MKIVVDIQLLRSLTTISKGIGVKPWLRLVEGEAPVFADLEIFGMATAMARHAGTRQTIIAQNIANSDTPGYRARDTPSFQSLVSGNELGNGFLSLRTRNGHLFAASQTQPSSAHFSDARTEPSGNSVSIEEEMMKAADVARQHSRALAIYQSSLDIIRTSLGRA
ncbi:MAG: FlgB family protein [Paracoccaceae bacterium]